MQTWQARGTLLPSAATLHCMVHSSRFPQSMARTNLCIACEHSVVTQRQIEVFAQIALMPAGHYIVVSIFFSIITMVQAVHAWEAYPGSACNKASQREQGLASLIYITEIPPRQYSVSDTFKYLDGCQNYDPFLGTLNIRCRVIIGIQKGTIILTTTHLIPKDNGPWGRGAAHDQGCRT